MHLPRSIEVVLCLRQALAPLSPPAVNHFCSQMDGIEFVSLAISAIIDKNRLSAIQVWRDYSVCLKRDPEEASKAVEHAPSQLVVNNRIDRPITAHTNASIVYYLCSPTGPKVS